MNIVEPIFAQCRNKPSELALCAPGTEFNLVSYARLQHSVDNICRRIIAAGIAPRSRVGVVIDDPIFHAMILIALTRLGIITISGERSDLSHGRSRSMAWSPTGRLNRLPARPLVADAGWTTGDDQPIEEKHLYRAAADDLCRIFLTSARRPTKSDRDDAWHDRHPARSAKTVFRPARAVLRPHLSRPAAGAPLGFQVMLATLWRGGALVMTWDAGKTLAAFPLTMFKTWSPRRKACSTLPRRSKATPAIAASWRRCFRRADLRSRPVRTGPRPFMFESDSGLRSERMRTMVASMPAHFASALRALWATSCRA